MRVSKTRKYAFSIFITLLISTMSLSLFAFAADPRTLLPEVQEIIVKKTWHGEMVQSVEYNLLKWLAYVVDYISEAVDQVLNFNLYNVIKDVFNIDTIIYPIAWALAGMTVVLIGILIIVNADKIHITDYVRNILTSLFFLIALPILVSSFTDLKTVGVQFAKDNTTKDTATNRTIGEYILASNIYNVNSSINQNKLVKQSQVSSFGVNPSTVYSMNINLGLDPSKTQYRTVTTADHYDVTPTYRFDDLTFEHKLELLDLVDDYAFWQQRVSWAQATADSDDEPYKITITRGEGNNRHSTDYYVITSQAPYYQASFEYYIICEAAENAAHELQNRGITIQASQVASMIMYCQNSDTFEEAINRLSKGAFRELDFYGNAMSAIQILNISNIEDFADNGFEHHSGGSFEQLKEASDFSDGDMSAQFDKLWQYVSVGHLTENNHFYRVNFLWGLFMLIMTAVCLIFAGLKLASLLYDIMFAQIIAPIVVATDMGGAGRLKKVILNLLNCFLSVIIVVLDLRLYILILTEIQDSSLLSNPIAVIFITVAGCKFVIDGPDLVVHLLGIDAGVKSGVSTIMGLRSAGQIASGAGHTLGHIAGKGISKAGGTVAGGIGGAISGGISGAKASMANARNSDNKAEKGMRGAVGAVGGAVAGGVSGMVGGFGSNNGVMGAAANGTAVGGKAGEVANKPIGEVAKSAGQNLSGKAMGMGEKLGVGTSGKDGKDGTNGIDGLNGKDGLQGENGKQGEQGESGEFSSNIDNSSSENAVAQGSFGSDSTNAGMDGSQTASAVTPPSISTSGGSFGTDTSASSAQAVNSGSYNAQTFADRQYHAESNTTSYADTAMATEKTQPTFAEKAMRDENKRK
ncbi:hypothetical protein [Ruminococcus sp.]|uniref:hypothetical protein n=1 Tax=Ruminococcus sp. TaxID=41978 RepID=UPI002E77544F|nr:hypothetical protein [Ruminococcus sp.]MEE0047009.1 hypothetical protein [Ruminococcus sp.]